MGATERGRGLAAVVGLLMVAVALVLGTGGRGGITVVTAEPGVDATDTAPDVAAVAITPRPRAGSAVHGTDEASSGRSLLPGPVAAAGLLLVAVAARVATGAAPSAPPVWCRRHSLVLRAPPGLRLAPT